MNNEVDDNLYDERIPSEQDLQINVNSAIYSARSGSSKEQQYYQTLLQQEPFTDFGSIPQNLQDTPQKGLQHDTKITIDDILKNLPSYKVKEQAPVDLGIKQTTYLQPKNQSPSPVKDDDVPERASPPSHEKLKSERVKRHYTENPFQQPQTQVVNEVPYTQSIPYRQDILNKPIIENVPAGNFEDKFELPSKSIVEPKDRAFEDFPATRHVGDLYGKVGGPQSIEPHFKLPVKTQEFIPPKRSSDIGIPQRISIENPLSSSIKSQDPTVPVRFSTEKLPESLPDRILYEFAQPSKSTEYSVIETPQNIQVPPRKSQEPTPPRKSSGDSVSSDKRNSIEPKKPDVIPGLSSYEFTRGFQNPYTNVNTHKEPAKDTKQDQIPTRHKDNPMFYSQTIEMDRRNSLPSQAFTGSYFDQVDARSSEGGGPKREKKDNPMFYSQAVNAPVIEPGKKNPTDIFSEVMLPKHALKALEDQEEAIRLMEHHVTQEKYKASIDMDHILEEIAEILNARKLAVNKKLDTHLGLYKQNYDILREKVVAYKDKVKGFFHQKEDKEKFLNPNQAFNPLLKSIQFYKIIPEQGNFIKFKEETCSIEGNATAINREADKKLIGLMAEEVSKQATHQPFYNHTQTLQSYYADLKKQIVSKVRDAFPTNYGEEMVYIPTLERFSTYFAFPKIESMLADDNMGVIGDSEKLVSMNPKLEKEIPVEPTNKALCVRAIPTDFVAMGCADGSVRVFNYTNNTFMTSFKAHSGTVSMMDIMKVQCPDLNELVLLTGSNDCSIRAWQLPTQRCVRLLKGHKGTVTSTIPIKDGITLLSSSEDGNILIWNMNSGKLFNKLSQHSKTINALHMFKDGTKFASVSDDKTICIWKVIYSYSNEFLRRTFSSADVEKVFYDDCEVTSVNSSADDLNMLITGGADNKVKIWNLEENNCVKQISAHLFGISSILFIENPFKLATYERYIILTAGYGEDSVKMIRSKSEFSEPMLNTGNAMTQRENAGTFRMQLVKSRILDTLKLITLSQQAGKGISIWGLE